MISKALYDLVNREIDGQTSPEESKRLHTLIEADPELRDAYDGLKQMANEMSGLKPAAPPPSLKHAIMRSIESGRQAKSVRSRRSTANAWRIGLTFCGGLAAGFLVFIMFSSPEGSGISDSELTGTIAHQGFPLELTQVERLDINDRAVQGKIESRGGRGLCLLHVDLASAEEATLRVHFDPMTVRIAAIRPSDESQTSLFFQEGQVIITGKIAGPLDIVFSTRKDDLPPAKVEIEAGGRSVISSSLKLQSIGS